MKLPRQQRKEPTENIIPLINVVFLLLIFFMISAKLTSDDALRIHPPVSSGETEKRDHTGATLYFTDRGVLVYAETEFELGPLIDHLKNDSTALPDSRMLIKADAHAPADGLLRLMTALREVGKVDIELLAETQP